jgi:hypothetical protein
MKTTQTTPEGIMDRFIVMTAAATPSSTCWGIYRRVAVVEIEPGFNDRPKMISARAKGIKRVVETWENCNVGTTDRCAFRRAEKEAQELADELNNA